MTPRQSPPKIAMYLAALTAPKDRRSEILGDLEEQFRCSTEPIRLNRSVWFWIQVIRSAPFFIVTRIHQKIGAIVYQLVAFSSLLLAMFAWDDLIVRQPAWSITARFLDTNMMPIPLLWHSIHIILYLTGVVILIVGARSLDSHAQSGSHPLWNRFGVLAMLLSAPPLYQVINPDSTEPILFGLIQLASIWLVVFAAKRIILTRGLFSAR